MSSFLKKRQLLANSVFSPTLIHEHPILNTEGNIQDKANLITQLLRTPRGLQEALQAVMMLTRLRKENSAEAFVSAGAVTVLIDLAHSEDVKLQEQATWCLCNIASGDHDCAVALLSKGIIPLCVGLLSSLNKELHLHGVMTLWNLSLDTLDVKNVLVDNKVLHRLLGLITASQFPDSKYFHKLVWGAICHLLEAKTAPFELDESILMLFEEKLRTHKSVSSTRVGLYNFTVRENSRIQSVVDRGLVSILLQTLPSLKQKAQLYTVKCLGNISAGEIWQAQVLFDLSALCSLHSILESPLSTGKMRQQVCWTLANLAAGSSTQVEALVGHPILSDTLKYYQSEYVDAAVETSYIHYNLTQIGTDPVLLALFNLGLVSALSSALGSSNSNKVFRMNILKTCRNLLEFGEKLAENQVLTNSIEFGLRDEIGRISYTPDLEVNQFAVFVLKRFFEDRVQSGSLERPSYFSF